MINSMMTKWQQQRIKRASEREKPVVDLESMPFGISAVSFAGNREIFKRTELFINVSPVE